MARVLSPEELAEIRERVRKHLHREIWRDDQDNLLKTIDALQAVVTAVEAKSAAGWEKELALHAAEHHEMEQRAALINAIEECLPTQGESVKPHGGKE